MKGAHIPCLGVFCTTLMPCPSSSVPGPILYVTSESLPAFLSQNSCHEVMMGEIYKIHLKQTQSETTTRIYNCVQTDFSVRLAKIFTISLR